MALPPLLFVAVVGSQAPDDPTTQPLWMVLREDRMLILADVPPPSEAPQGPVEVTFWMLEPARDGVDATAGRLTVTCAHRSFVAHSFSGYLGTTHVGTAAAQNTAPEVVEPGTAFGVMVDHLCDPQPDRSQTSDFSNLEQAQAARRGTNP